MDYVKKSLYRSDIRNQASLRSVGEFFGDL